jgi:superfamily I DNA/RNA helicase
MVDKLQQAAAAAVETAGAYDKRRRVQQRLENLEALLDKAARMDASTSLNIMLDDALSESDADTDDRGGFSSSSSSSAAGSGSMITSGEGGSSGSSGSSSSSTPDTSTLLHQFMDYCGLQGDGDDEEGGTGGVREPRVEFMTIHASKGKEFGCVAVMAFNEGVLPSDRAETAEELEQERNTAYVAVTRAKDNLLITWSKVMVRGYYTMQLRPSRYIDNVLFESRRGQMHGVEFEEDEVEEEGFSRSWQ